VTLGQKNLSHKSRHFRPLLGKAVVRHYIILIWRVI